MNRKALQPILTLLFCALLCVCLLAGGLPERGAASTAQLPKWSGDKAVTTNIRDAYPITRWLEGFDKKVKPVETAASFNLPPGYYRFTIQSYCLHAGTWGPTQGDGYLLAPLKGDRADLIRAILQRSVQHPNIAQQDIQRLIWSIEAGAKFTDFSHDFQLRVQPLLTPGEIAAMSVDIGEVKSVLGRFIPGGARRALDIYSDMRQRVTDAQTSYQQLEQLAVRTGVAPEGKGSRTISSGNWSYASDTFYVRTFPEGYPTTVIEILLPLVCYRIERDGRGRITLFETGDNRIEASYTDAAGGDQRVWHFKTIRLSGARPSDALTARDSGWVVASTAASYSAGRTAVDAGQGADEVAARIREAGDKWNKLNQYRAEWKRAQQPQSEQVVRDFTDLTHYVEGVEAAVNPAASSGGSNSETAGEHLARVRFAWSYLACVLSGDCLLEAPGPGANCARVFDPSDEVAAPGNTSKQRLGLSARLKRRG
jgi:hypothetical protein